MHVSFTLPAEIWEEILDLLDTNSLLNFQHTCHTWRNIILEYIMRGRLRNHALVKHRLTLKENDLLHHKRNIWNTLCIEPQGNFLLLGFGVYTGRDDELFDKDANIVFDRCTTTINILRSNGEILSTQTIIVDTEMAKKIARKSIFKNCMSVFLDVPLLLKKGEKYDIEHNLLPTDVSNHFSGYPITKLGADLWTCYGLKKEIFDFGFMKFSSVEDRRRGRCSLEIGQMPYIVYWPLH